MTLPKAEDMQARADAAFDEGKRGVPPANDVHADVEARALDVCLAVFDELDDVARGRVLLDLARRYGVDVG